MSYKDKPQIRLYEYEGGEFVLMAIIDDFKECSFEMNRYNAGEFSIAINYNIPNALKFARGLFVQFGNNPYQFGEILSVTDAIGSDGKGSQTRTITGYDARYLFKRRVIRNLNSEGTWDMTAKGELCMRNLIADQCGANAEEKRRLPIANVIPSESEAIGAEYSVSEAYSNLYETLATIATQSEAGWRVAFRNNALTLEFYEGSDLHESVRFDTDYDSLSSGEFTDTASSYANTIYVGGKGTGSDRDIYEGEDVTDGTSPAGLDRYEAWDNQSSMTSEDEYSAEALSMLSQYGQTLSVSGQGLAKCPYVYGEQYDVGDTITIAFSGKSAVVRILSVTEHWSWNSYDLEFSFGKPRNDLARQLQLMLRQIQKASDSTTTTSSVKYYEIPTDTEMPKADVIYDTIGFMGECASGGSMYTLYYNADGTGAKNYHVWLKGLSGGKLTLTTGVSGKASLELNSGTYVAFVYVDAEGNVLSQGATATSSVSSGSTQPTTSGAVYNYAHGTAYLNTGASSSAKTAIMLDYPLQAGERFPITVANSNTYAGALTLNVNSTGAKSLYINGSASSSSNYSLPAGTFSCTYNGTYYNIDTDGGLTASGPIRGTLNQTVVLGTISATGSGSSYANMTLPDDLDWSDIDHLVFHFLAGNASRTLHTGIFVIDEDCLQYTNAHGSNLQFHYPDNSDYDGDLYFNKSTKKIYFASIMAKCKIFAFLRKSV